MNLKRAHINFPTSLTGEVVDEGLVNTISIADFDEELDKRQKVIDDWFEKVEHYNLQKTVEPFRDDDNNTYSLLLTSMREACDNYEKEKLENPQLDLPHIPKESIAGMLMLFPFLLKKKPSFHIDSDLACVSVSFNAQEENQITIATKTTRLLFLSKVGETSNSTRPFSLSSTLKLSNADSLKRIEEMLSYL